MTDEQIEQAWQDAWEEFGDDVSTEFLLHITADRCDCDVSCVVSAIVAVETKDRLP